MSPFLKISVIWAILNFSRKKEILIIIANGIFGPTSFLEFKLPIIDSLPSFVTASTKNEFQFWFFRQLGKHLLDFGVLLSIFQLFFQRIYWIFLRFFLFFIILSPVYRQVGCVLLDLLLSIISFIPFRTLIRFVLSSSK